MGERAEIRNPKYKKSLLKKDKIQEMNNNPDAAEPAHTHSFLGNLKGGMTKGTEKMAQSAKKAVCTLVEQAAPVVSEVKEKASELWNDRILPKDPPAEDVVSIAQPDWDALILEEVESKSSYFASLLNLTDTLVASEHFGQKDAEQLVQKWEYAFQIGECVGISHKLAELRHDQDAKAQLAGIMQLFHHLGLKKLDVQNPVAVSPENRFYFDNGTQFPDGTVCEIARWPWLYKGKVYYRGMLRQLEDEQVL